MTETILSICLGLGLSAAAGFRVFVPFLFLNLASRAELIELSDQFFWMGQTPALITFAVATGLEVGGYYVPWIDNLMDTLASPAAIIAGVVATASVVTGLEPSLKWTLAVIAGGGVAGIVQTASVGTRQFSLLTTGGLGNPIVASLEFVSSVLLSVLSFLLPLVAGLLVLLLVLIALKLFWRRRSVQEKAI